jgi:hypothetical protein
MKRIRRIEVPAHSLLSRYARPDTYVDCYSTLVSGRASHTQFVEAFYTTALFRLERFLLGALASRPSTDAEARLLALGERSAFAAWLVEARAPNEVLLSAGRTRSWLMIVPSADGAGTDTQLLFGSAVIARRQGGLGAGFRALLGFHKLYSRALLLSARLRLSGEINAA